MFRRSISSRLFARLAAFSVDQTHASARNRPFAAQVRRLHLGANDDVLRARRRQSPGTWMECESSDLCDLVCTSRPKSVEFWETSSTSFPFWEVGSR